MGVRKGAKTGICLRTKNVRKSEGRTLDPIT